MPSTTLDGSQESSSHHRVDGWVDGEKRGKSFFSDPTRVACTTERGRPKNSEPPLESGCVLAGRYHVVRCLGTGGFSQVYLAQDLSLERRVAVKRTFDLKAQSEVALQEAKTVASLDHPGIVRIYDVIHDEQIGLLIVMQFVNGSNLQSILKSTRLAPRRAVEIVRQVAIAASHAHAHGVVHRDIKPANILIDSGENALLTDFGLAWTDTLGSSFPGKSGTLRYMSPEQMRDETHRIDARSDVFSLGIVLYEMLTGRLPFPGRDWAEIAEATLSVEPYSASANNPDVPVELDRICRRALRKSVKDRFPNMTEFADALLKVQALLPNTSNQFERAVEQLPNPDSRFFDSVSSPQELIVPRGLQPYQRTDSEWFCHLVSGARHYSGMPESIYAWTQWVELASSRDTDRLGVLHGAPGSGKTSFVQAGLLASLAPQVASVTVECCAGNLTARICRAIASQLGLASSEVNLSELIKRLRLEETVESEYQKVLIVLDQFEVWANSANPQDFARLGAALRQCDGEHVQVLVVVDDEHWARATELSALVEVPLLEGQNLRPMQLLSSRHARKILELMGRTYGTLPSVHEVPVDSYDEFLERSTEELGRDHSGRILPIQIAIFAQMAELHHWSADLLEQSGGLAGLYVKYFEDQFESETAPTKNRKALPDIAKILSLFLPAPDQSVRERVVSVEELEEQLALSTSHEQIQRVVRVLSEETKVLVRAASAPDSARPSQVFYRVANDFLTEPLRIWTERINKSTRHGLAVARFHELFGMWERQADRRFLPSALECVSILRATRQIRKTVKQREYLAQAVKLHGVRLGVGMLAVLIACTLIYRGLAAQWNADAHEKELVRVQFQLLLTSNPAQVPTTIENLLRMSQRELVVDLASQAQFEPRNELRCMLLRARLQPDAWGIVLNRLDQLELAAGEAVIVGAQEEPLVKEALLSLFQSADSEKARVRAAITLAYLDEYGPIEELLDFSSGADVSLETVRTAAFWKARDSVQIWQPLLASKSASVRYCAIAILGSFPQPSLAREFPQLELELVRLMQGPYRSQQAVRWLARQAKVQFFAHSRAGRIGLDWLPTIFSFDMVKVSVEPLPEACSQGYSGVPNANLDVPMYHSRVWLTSTCVPAEILQEFYDEHPELERPEDLEKAPDKAVGKQFNFADVGLFCNWLSEREGLEPAYSGQVHPTAGNHPGLRPRATGGYRIPTSEELLCGLAGSLDTWKSPKMATTVYEASGRSFEENIIRHDREIDAMLPNTIGIYCNDPGFPALASTRNGWVHLLHTGKSFYGYRLDKKTVSNLTCLVLARDCTDKERVALR